MEATTTNLKEFVKSHFALMDRHQWGEVEDHYTADSLFHTGSNPPMTKREHAEFGKAFYAAFPDGRHEIAGVYQDGSMFFVRGRWSGTQTGTFNGIPPTGKRVDFSWLGQMRIEDGRIAEEWVEMDAIGMMMQLGVFPAPGAQ
jgi:predicted ester cyclase